jgi:transposase-like protein
MTKKTRRRFTPEYKEQTLARMPEPGVTYANLSAELGDHVRAVEDLAS